MRKIKVRLIFYDELRQTMDWFENNTFGHRRGDLGIIIMMEGLLIVGKHKHLNYYEMERYFRSDAFLKTF